MTIKQLLKLAELNYTNRLYKSCPHLFIQVKSTPIKDPALLHINHELLNILEISPYEIEKSSFIKFINGDLDFEGLLFGSTYYSGHQFGYFVPKLGDGRALFLGEVTNSKGATFELQLKGSGPTPFSRMGDGRAVVRSSIREYLASAHLKALGVPTTEALAIIHGSDDVYREEVEKAAIVLRVAESFLRFGHLQYYAHSNQITELKSLLDFTIKTYFKNYSDHPNQYLLFFQDIVKKTAKLFASWQAIGFCHGVLNTDNMSILGLTIDYGPYGFIDSFDLDFICNHSDHEGRYSFGHQPAIGMWNLEQLGSTLKNFISEGDIKRTLESYPGLFHYEYRSLIKKKLGLYVNNANDDDIVQKTIKMLAITQIDYTQFFRLLSHYKKDDFSLPLTESEELKTFLQIYNERLIFEEISDQERNARMLLINPKFILRNYLAQMAIENYQANPLIFEEIFKVLTHPFEEWSDPDNNHENWSKPATSESARIIVSCSS